MNRSDCCGVVLACPKLLLAAFCVLALSAAPSLAQNVEKCSATNSSGQHILPPGDANTDLEVNGVNCIVDGSAMSGGVSGSYVYRNVNIWNKGTLTFNDAQIDFHAHSILVERDGTLMTAGAINGPLTIWLWGGPKPADTIDSITCKSDTKNQCGIPDALWTSNPNVAMQMKPTMPCNPASKYGVMLPMNDCFYPYEVFDSGDKAGAYFGRKVLALSAGGTIMLSGAKGIRTGMPMEAKPADSGTSWGRLNKDVTDGLTLVLDREMTTWAPGDHIVVTTTDYLPGHTEERVIGTIKTVGGVSQIVLTQKLTYPHSGTAYDYSATQKANPTAGPAADPNLTTLAAGHIETRAIVALLTRSVVIASEGLTPTLARNADHFPETIGNFYGGQTVVRDGFSTYQMQGIEFYQLGQAGVIGRYPVHFHMARNVPQPDGSFLGTYVADSSIVDSMTRFITLHATQGVTLARNVGYKSIGHGFYLEDATETNNRIYSNAALSVRAAIRNPATNPRQAPGILDLPLNMYPPPLPPAPVIPPKPGNIVYADQPYVGDISTPSAFWVMNTWNDMEYNAAVGANACGACYWLPPAGVSGPSRYETWKGYAAMQLNSNLQGAVPTDVFKGNMCSAAMFSLLTIGSTTACTGLIYGPASDAPNTLVTIVNPNPVPLPLDSYPIVNGQRAKTTNCTDQTSDCSAVPACTGSGAGLANCIPFVVDHFTTSFNWAPTNFAAVWLRGWWYLLQNSAITDSQNGGVTFVTGGGYTRSDVAQGYWSVMKNSVLVGNTQPIIGDTQLPANAFASNAGPFNPKGEICPYNVGRCVSMQSGTTFILSNFGNNQRMFNIYDGPTSEFSNIYADIHPTIVATLGKCKSDPKLPGSCAQSNWANAYLPGVLQYPPTRELTSSCVLANAAIAWKQPNGFYYPPVFSSANLVFKDAPLRHFVIEPAYFPGTLNEDSDLITKTYCSWEPRMFKDSFTDIDRETELSDVDGSLTGLVANDPTSMPAQRSTVSVNKDAFFTVPLDTDECASGQSGSPTAKNDGATANTSPYEYLTTAVFPECARGNRDCGGNWLQNCANPQCYGVPLYRQYLTPTEITAFEKDPNNRPSIRMMGQASGQRSTMTLNHGSYYIDTTVPSSTQSVSGPFVSLFKQGVNYDFFLVFARNATHQKYTIFIGTGLSQEAGMAAFKPGRMLIPDNDFPFNPDESGTWATATYDSGSGLLSIDINLANAADLNTKNLGDFCQPKTYCAWDSTKNSCGCKAGTSCKDSNVCAFATSDIDCPVDGCYGFQIAMPTNTSDAQKTPPLPQPFSAEPYFAGVTFKRGTTNTSDACYYKDVPAASLKLPE